ncbi:Mss4-like protein, partial [Mortierella sp. GBAus27b]
LIYEDIISKDELFSDAFPLKDNGAVYEIDCKMITVKEGADVDIGANPSTEEGEEALEDGMITVNNLVYSNRLQQTTFDKKGYLVYLKEYMKTLKGLIADEEERTKFETDAQAAAKKIVANFKDYEFYTGSNMDPKGAVMLLNYREDGITPFFTVFKAGLKATKVVSDLDTVPFNVMSRRDSKMVPNVCFCASVHIVNLQARPSFIPGRKTCIKAVEKNCNTNCGKQRDRHYFAPLNLSLFNTERHDGNQNLLLRSCRQGYQNCIRRVTTTIWFL